MSIVDLAKKSLLEVMFFLNLFTNIDEECTLYLCKCVVCQRRRLRKNSGGRGENGSCHYTYIYIRGADFEKFLGGPERQSPLYIDIYVCVYMYICIQFINN